MKKFNLFVFLFTFLNLKSQSVDFDVIDSFTNEKLSYVSVINKTAEKYTKTNYEGSVKIPYNSDEDSLIIKYIGYNEVRIKIKNIGKLVKMSKKNQNIAAVTIRPTSKKYLYDIIDNCRERLFYIDYKFNSKSYFLLRSWIGSQQIELLEAYYNTQTNGYNIENNYLKAGRVALQKDSIYHRMFTSLDGAKPLFQLDWKTKRNIMPDFILNYNKKKQKKYFWVEELERYKDEYKDSIIRIAIIPKDSSGQFLGGEIHIDIFTNEIIKIIVSGDNLVKYPLQSIHTNDILDRVKIKITSIYKKQENKRTVDYINFEIESSYISKKEPTQPIKYPIYTQAILSLYDYNTLFELPIYKSPINNEISDYTNILAYPYNEFFWRYNDEFRIESTYKENQVFFDNALVNNQNHFDILNTKILKEYKFVNWSRNRIHFIEDIKERILFVNSQKSDDHTSAILINKSDKRIFDTKFNDYTILKQIYGNKEKPYNFDIQIFLDYNKYLDSSNVLTATIFNPYNSYYYLRVDNPIRVFMNLYFDIAEVERLNMIEELNNVKDYSRNGILETYEKYSKYKEEIWNNLSQETQNGVIKNRMKKWNDYIKNTLDIDNFKFFGL